ncbi:MAG: ATP-binding cassette domain-containing protein [Novosphingobium meiothermophilum]
MTAQMKIEQMLGKAALRQRRTTRLAIALAVMAAVAGVALLGLSGWFLTGAAMAGASGIAAVQAFNYLLPSAGIRAMAIARTLGRYGERLLSHRAALFALADLRPALFAQAAGAEARLALGLSAGEAAARLGSDVDALEDSVVRQVTRPAAIAAALAGLGASLLAGWASALALLSGLAVMRLASLALAPRLLAGPRQDHAAALGRLKADYAAYAACPGEIAAYGLEPRILAALEPDVQALERARLAIVRGEALVLATQVVLSGASAALVLALAGSGPALAALAGLAGAAAAEGISALSRTDMERLRVGDALERLETLAALPARRGAGAEGLAAREIVIAIAGTRHVLAPGDRILIDGYSGSGKSRLLGTLAGLRDDAPERLEIGGQDVRALGLEALRPLFAHAPQDAALIAGTVADNLRLARAGLNEADMWQALETACLAQTVRALPQGLYQWLGEDGARLSGGERKRLSLARALLARRPWLVLDEPSEGLDAETERELCSRLRHWLDETGSGLVLVSHRTGLHGLAQRRLVIAPETVRA